MFLRSLFSVLLLVGALGPNLVYGHTSDERYLDGSIIDLSTAPIAPFSGEQVGFLFSILDPKDFTVIDRFKTARISVERLFTDSGKPQATIFTSEEITIDRGTVNFSYVFPETGTYDVHIALTDREGKEHVTGYRRQVRGTSEAPVPGSSRSGTDTNAMMLGGGMFMVGLALGICGGFFLKKKGV